VSRRYIFPRSRRGAALAGLGLALLFLLVYLVSANLRASEFVSGGPLSSDHASFETDCARCHSPFRGTPEEKCGTCHEPSNDGAGVYSFSRHYLYRSDDPKRFAGTEASRAHEQPCASCHPEHDGRDSGLLSVPDRKCLVCHDYGSFERNHPAFDFEAAKLPDDESLLFTHQRHVRFVLDRTGDPYVSRACLACHVPRPDGKTFHPISYDEHCGGCHLTTGKKTGRLTIGNPALAGGVGVLTPDAMLARGRTGSYWAAISNSAEFQKAGPEISKSPVIHRDPWILENLREIRRVLHPDLGLADLVPTYGLAGTETARDLYDDALTTVEGYRAALRSRPERPVQAELRALGKEIRDLRGALHERDVYPSIDPFLEPYKTENPALTPAHRAALFELADTLTSLCRECHVIAHASIGRVQKDQAILERARFDHRAHVVDRDCLECHDRIPMDRKAPANESLSDDEWKAVVAQGDRAAVQNLPGIESCRECHGSGRTAAACVTCHDFHPDKTTRQTLVLGGS
jgi:hypothetical protein